ncbi:hypothetical protein [Streptomyces sp. YS-3]|uniref:hypothetical protein n=1 Tax=Streptomyces sp. YS-3 TaxID=3381352 RepID=UPI003862CB49
MSSDVVQAVARVWALWNLIVGAIAERAFGDLLGWLLHSGASTSTGWARPLAAGLKRRRRRRADVVDDP